MKKMKNLKHKKDSKPDFTVCLPHTKPICSPAHPLKLPSRRRNPLNTVALPEETSDPISPKVTCAGKIKAKKPIPAAGKTKPQRVNPEIGEIEANSNNRTGNKSRRVFSWFRFPKFRLNLKCLGTSSAAEFESQLGSRNDAVPTVFSKWVMILGEEDDAIESSSEPPPANALLLMRCRSAPAMEKSRSGEEAVRNLREKMAMRSEADFYKLGSNMGDPFCRSMSWKR